MYTESVTDTDNSLSQLNLLWTCFRAPIRLFTYIYSYACSQPLAYLHPFTIGREGGRCHCQSSDSALYLFRRHCGETNTKLLTYEDVITKECCPSRRRSKARARWPCTTRRICSDSGRDQGRR